MPGRALALALPLTAALAIAARAEAPPRDGADDCARHLNRLLSERVGRRVLGNAWDVQLLPVNRSLLPLRFRAAPLRYRGATGDDALVLAREADRVRHFRALYAALDRARAPVVGVIGFVYRFSVWRERVQALSRRSSLPQTHVVLVDGRRRFAIRNERGEPRTLGELLGERLGVILPEERALLQERLGAPLWTRLAPGAKHELSDYLVRQHFVHRREGPLYELLRKLPADRQTPMFRPVSFSPLSAPARGRE